MTAWQDVFLQGRVYRRQEGVPIALESRRAVLKEEAIREIKG